MPEPTWQDYLRAMAVRLGYRPGIVTDEQRARYGLPTEPNPVSQFFAGARYMAPRQPMITDEQRARYGLDMPLMAGAGLGAQYGRPQMTGGPYQVPDTPYLQRPDPIPVGDLARWPVRALPRYAEAVGGMGAEMAAQADIPGRLAWQAEGREMRPSRFAEAAIPRPFSYEPWPTRTYSPGFGRGGGSFPGGGGGGGGGGGDLFPWAPGGSAPYLPTIMRSDLGPPAAGAGGWGQQAPAIPGAGGASPYLPLVLKDAAGGSVPWGQQAPAVPGMGGTGPYLPLRMKGTAGAGGGPGPSRFPAYASPTGLYLPVTMRGSAGAGYGPPTMGAGPGAAPPSVPGGGGGAPPPPQYAPAPEGAPDWLRHWYTRFQQEHEGATPESYYKETGMQARGRGEGLAEALADLEWSQREAARTGRPPTEQEWQDHYYRSRRMPNPRDVAAARERKAARREVKGMGRKQYLRKVRRAREAGDQEEVRRLKKAYRSVGGRRRWQDWKARQAASEQQAPAQEPVYQAGGPGGIPLFGPGGYFGGPAAIGPPNTATPGGAGGRQAGAGGGYFGGPAALPPGNQVAPGGQPGRQIGPPGMINQVTPGGPGGRQAQVVNPITGQEAMRQAREAMRRYGEPEATYGIGPGGTPGFGGGGYFGGPAPWSPGRMQGQYPDYTRGAAIYNPAPGPWQGTRPGSRFGVSPGNLPPVPEPQEPRPPLFRPPELYWRI